MAKAINAAALMVAIWARLGVCFVPSHGYIPFVSMLCSVKNNISNQVVLQFPSPAHKLDNAFERQACDNTRQSPHRKPGYVKIVRF